MFNDYDHDRMSFTCAFSLINTIFFLAMVLASWPRGHAPVLWDPTSPIIVQANHLARGCMPPPVMGPDIAHSCASQPHYY